MLMTLCLCFHPHKPLEREMSPALCSWSMAFNTRCLPQACNNLKSGGPSNPTSCAYLSDHMLGSVQLGAL